MDKIKMIVKIIILPAIALVILEVLFYNGERRLGAGYIYDTEGKRIFGPNINIPPNVVDVYNSRRCIVVKQKPSAQIEEDIYDRTYSYPFGRDTIYYWIIYKKEHHYCGPLLYDDMKDLLKTDKIDINL